MKKGFHVFIRKLLKLYFRRISAKQKFSIISNDCWGAEIYKILNRPFNTPFIGLMLMSPCYIKLLENPQYYLSLPIHFKQQSKYSSIQKIQESSYFPIGVLGESEIEIQFLHYSSEEIAAEKWTRRVKRIDWNNLFVKYDCGKDYATKEHIDKLISLDYEHVLIFGNHDYGSDKVIIMNQYSKNAVEQFKNCFLSFNPINWIIGNEKKSGLFDLFIRKISYQFL